jgi:hypothetical protein
MGGEIMNLRELVKHVGKISEQDIPVCFKNGNGLFNIENIFLVETGGKLAIQLEGPKTAVRSYTIGSRITDRAEIARITKTSANRNGYQIRTEASL